MIPISHTQQTGIAAATALPGLPAAGNAEHALVTVAVQPVRLRDDGTAPTAAIGHLKPVGSIFWISGKDRLKKMRIIETAVGTVVDISYYYEDIPDDVAPQG